MYRMVVGRNDEACIRYLLAHGADPNLGPPMNAQGPIAQRRPQQNSGWNLDSAATHRTPDIFALLLSYGARLENAIPLHHAAGSGPSPHGLPRTTRMPMLEYLVGLGLDVNALDTGETTAPDGRGRTGTPLQYDVLWGCVEEAKWLLDRGADPDKTSCFGVSARDRAKRLPLGHEISVLLQGI